MTQVRIKVLRAFCIRGEPLEVGAVVKLNPIDANSVLGYKAELVDPSDKIVIAHAVQEANRIALAQAGRVRPEPFGPWQR